MAGQAREPRRREPPEEMRSFQHSRGVARELVRVFPAGGGGGGERLEAGDERRDARDGDAPGPLGVRGGLGAERYPEVAQAVAPRRERLQGRVRDLRAVAEVDGLEDELRPPAGATDRLEFASRR